jgi:hypothetical protein
MQFVLLLSPMSWHAFRHWPLMKLPPTTLKKVDAFSEQHPSLNVTKPCSRDIASPPFVINTQCLLKQDDLSTHHIRAVSSDLQNPTPIAVFNQTSWRRMALGRLQILAYDPEKDQFGTLQVEQL